MSEIESLKAEILSLKLQIEVKDEALKEVLSHRSADIDNAHSWWVGETSFIICDKALSPNSAQPLMELVREMREALNEASQFDEVYGKPTEGSNGRHVAYRLMIQRTDAALTKAAQLGF